MSEEPPCCYRHRLNTTINVCTHPFEEDGEGHPECRRNEPLCPVRHTVYDPSSKTYSWKEKKKLPNTQIDDKEKRK